LGDVGAAPFCRRPGTRRVRSRAGRLSPWPQRWAGWLPHCPVRIARCSITAASRPSPARLGPGSWPPLDQA